MTPGFDDPRARILENQPSRMRFIRARADHKYRFSTGERPRRSSLFRSHAQRRGFVHGGRFETIALDLFRGIWPAGPARGHDAEIG